LNCTSSPGSLRPPSRAETCVRPGVNPASVASPLNFSCDKPAAFRESRRAVPYAMRTSGWTDRAIGPEEYCCEYYDPTAYRRHFCLIFTGYQCHRVGLWWRAVTVSSRAACATQLAASRNSGDEPCAFMQVRQLARDKVHPQSSPHPRESQSFGDSAETGVKSRATRS
jgi:hypothetical protein